MERADTDRQTLKWEIRIILKEIVKQKVKEKILHHGEVLSQLSSLTHIGW